jgi:hypothetical protein
VPDERAHAEVDDLADREQEAGALEDREEDRVAVPVGAARDAAEVPPLDARARVAVVVVRQVDAGRAGQGQRRSRRGEEPRHPPELTCCSSER